MRFVLYIFLFFYFFCKPIFAAPQITVNSLPSLIILGDPIPISFTIVNNGLGDSYHYKIVGVGVSVDNLPDSDCNNHYDSCPTFSVGTSETVQISSNAKIIAGSGEIKVRIAQIDNHNPTKESDPVSVNLISPTPSPTSSPTNTPVPTSIPPTNTPTPTKTPTPTHTPAPTKAPTPTLVPTVKNISPSPTLKPNPSLAVSPTPEEDSVLGLVTETEEVPTSPVSTPTPTPTLSLNKNNQKLANILPFVFIGLGGILLLTPLIISKINHHG